MKPFTLPKGLRLGVATASTQIEGGESNSNWNDWYRKGGIRDGSDPARANDHYRRYREDIDLMAQMGMQCYRMSIEWSRLEPQRDVFDDAEYQHYRDEITYLQSKGIEVLLTLHHFNNPMWFESLGGFEHKDSPLMFEAFVRHTMHKLGDLVDRYVTINEPNVYATSAYYFGEFPPGKKSVRACRVVMTNLARSHIRAYQVIHAWRKEHGYQPTLVGYASHVRVFEPLRKRNILDRIGCRLMRQMFQGGLDDTCMTGIRKFPLYRAKEFRAGKYYDFVGINYYSRSMVRGFTEMPNPDARHNDMGWELYPEGLAQVIDTYAERYHAPIYITENGTADAKDAFRSQFLYEHLYSLTQSQAKVERYYHWTFIDNFEWMDGESCRFGLVELDYETQQRKPRPSCYLYRDIIAAGGVTQEMIEKYLHA